VASEYANQAEKLLQQNLNTYMALPPPRYQSQQTEARGVKFGRKPKLTHQQIDHARKLIDGGERAKDVAAILNVDRTTLYRAAARSE
jgi:hypothetical protein